MVNRKITGTVLISVLLAAGIAAPAFAAESMSGDQAGEKSGQMATDSGMPATEAQAQQLKNVSDDAAGAATGEQGMEAGGMPATKAQKQQLKETPEMSSDKAETPDTGD